MRPLSLTAVLLAIALLPLSLGLGVNDHNRRQAAAQRAMDASGEAVVELVRRLRRAGA